VRTSRLRFAQSLKFERRRAFVVGSRILSDEACGASPPENSFPQCGFDTVFYTTEKVSRSLLACLVKTALKPARQHESAQLNGEV